MWVWQKKKKSQVAMKMTKIWDGVLYQWFSKCGPGTPGNPQDYFRWSIVSKQQS